VNAMWNLFVEKVAGLIARGESFAVATVVRCQPPTSGKSGDKAIVLADGAIWGWIGGGCAQPVVVAEAKKALSEGQPRLVRISPAGDREQANAEQGAVNYPMTCHSGGAMEIYIEPVLPRPSVVILGRSPVAQVLARLASVVNYAVTVVALEVEGGDFSGAVVVARNDFSLQDLKITAPGFVIVSTQGEGDEEALEEALKTDAAFIGFVASRTKAAKVFEYLRRKGVSDAKLNRVQAPAGLDLGAHSPEEIAVSILARIVQLKAESQAAQAAKTQQSASKKVAPPEAAEAAVAKAKDPICGMTVDTAKAKYKSERQGSTFYFCCAGCKQTFDLQSTLPIISG
jgi:xanthine dehydrogenase accessory factor